MSVHDAVVGNTGSGKSLLVRSLLLPAWRRKRVAALVLDPVAQTWGASSPWITQTPDPYIFLDLAQRARRCVLIVDECSQHVGINGQMARDLSWIATVSRNNGHKAYFIGQRMLHLPPSYRGQCGTGWVFRQSSEDAEIMCGLFGLEQRVWIPRITALPELHCYRIQSYLEPQPIVIPAPAGWRPINPHWKPGFPA